MLPIVPVRGMSDDILRVYGKMLQGRAICWFSIFLIVGGGRVSRGRPNGSVTSRHFDPLSKGTIRSGTPYLQAGRGRADTL